jgi:hypothetical protein
MPPTEFETAFYAAHGSDQTLVEICPATVSGSLATRAIADRGQVDDPRDVLLAAAPEERARRGTGVPRDAHSLGDPGDAQVLDHERFECPPQSAP